MPATVQHDTDRQRFYIEVEGGIAFMSYRMAGAGQVAFTHTETPQGVRGQGLAGKVVKEALAWARQEGVTVIPACSYVVTYLKRHPEEAEPPPTA